MPSGLTPEKSGPRAPCKHTTLNPVPLSQLRRTWVDPDAAPDDGQLQCTFLHCWMASVNINIEPFMHRPPQNQPAGLTQASRPSGSWSEAPQLQSAARPTLRSGSSFDDVQFQTSMHAHLSCHAVVLNLDCHHLQLHAFNMLDPAFFQIPLMSAA